jgi:LPXTG-site transpeptidase (sortase) family protein
MPAKTNKKKRVSKKESHLRKFLLLFGTVCILLGLFIVFSTYLPIASQEMSYNIRQLTQRTQSNIKNVPVNDRMGILIPKIGANASIILQVDPNDSKIYQRALTKGVAHAQGTALPGSEGNSFIFSHSSGNILDANRYNSIFYLLHKLIIGDEIWIYVNGTKFVYTVDMTKIVEPTDTSYLNPRSLRRQITLMTCWPPGTNLERLIVKATVKE